MMNTEMLPMSWLFAPFYDLLMKNTEAAGLGQWRQTLLREAYGRVLEIGGGTGANLSYYTGSVEQVVITEPDPGMKRQLDQKFRELNKSNFQTANAKAEDLPFEEASFDTVVSTLVLCTVDDPDKSLEEIFRVLRPGGKLLFLEHVHAHDNPGRAKWQGRIEPVWKHFAGGCHLTRDTLKTIERTGFTIEAVTRASLRKAPSFIRPCIRGYAIKQS
jgi:ubiquinone/menaquinone biosynthesis C-methylase UbiE